MKNIHSEILELKEEARVQLKRIQSINVDSEQAKTNLKNAKALQRRVKRLLRRTE